MSRRQRKVVKQQEPNLQDQYDQLMQLCVSLKTKIDTMETATPASAPVPAPAPAHAPAKNVEQKRKRAAKTVQVPTAPVSPPPVPVSPPPAPAAPAPAPAPVEKIKILILSTFKHGKEKFDLRHIRSQYQILAYQLDKYIKVNGENRFTVMHQTLPIRGTSTRIQRLPEHKSFDCVEVDFIIVCDNRGLHYRPSSFTEKLRTRARKGIFTFASNNAMVGGEDVLFYMVPNGKRNKRHCKYVGWTCDDSLCSPKQVKGRLQILIDHNYYGRHENMVKNDLTEDITVQVCEFAKKHKDHEVIVRRFIAGGVETVDIHNPQKMDKYVQGEGLSYEEACAEYSKTDIFIVTHKECMGLSVLESAMSGALVLTPEEYIKDDLLKNVHHIPFKNTIDWNYTLQNIDAKKARNKVIRFGINNFVKKILVVMSRIDYLRETNFEFKNSHN